MNFPWPPIDALYTQENLDLSVLNPSLWLNWKIDKRVISNYSSVHNLRLVQIMDYFYFLLMLFIDLSKGFLLLNIWLMNLLLFSCPCYMHNAVNAIPYNSNLSGDVIFGPIHHYVWW